MIVDSTNNNSFYTIEADVLISPSKKPKYIQQRFGARSKAHSQDSEAHQKYQLLLDNKKQKLSSRSDAVKAKLKSMQEKQMEDSESRFSRIEIKSKEAGEKRDLLLKQKSTSNANLVLRAKVIARVQHQKLKEELLVFQKNLEQRMRTTTFRRARNLLIPKSRLLDPKTRRESVVVQDEAALVIQDWFRERKFTPLVRVYRKVAVTKQIAKGMPFEQLMNRVQNQTTLKATTFLIIRAKRTADLKSKWVKPARVLLLAYVIALHPNEMFTELNPQEQDLIGLAAQLITELEHYVNFTSPQVICPLAKSFILLFSDFYSAFESWKVKDFGKVIKELVGHFIELDQLWISVRDHDNSAEEWGANIEKHQKMHFTRLKRYGEAAVASLLEARQQFKNDLEGAGTIVSISEDIPATSPAPSYYKSNSKNVKRIDSVMDNAEIAIEVERPTTKDMEMFGQLLGNEQIVHQIALDRNFKLQPAVKNEAQFHFEKIAKQALADAIDSEIQRQDYTKKCLVILSDIRASLQSMLNANGAIHREIAEVLDNEFLTHQMKNHAFDLHKTTSYIGSKMLQLCAPVRDAEIRSIETSKSLGVALVSILDILQSMKLDMANFRLESIKPYLKNEAVNFERNKFKAALEKGSISLEKTILWLGSSVNSIKETADQRNPEQLESLDLNIKFSRVLDQAFLGLFFAPTALEPASLAETLIGDVKRLFGFQNEFQGIAITAAVAHLAQNLVPAFKNQSQAMKELTKEMFELLQGPSTSLATISNLIIEKANDLMHHQGRDKANLSNLTSLPAQQQLCELSAEKVQLVRSMVDKTLSLKDPFLSVIVRRIEKITRLYLQDDNKKLSYASNGLLLVQTELENLLERIGILVKHNRNVFGPYYDSIISQLLTQ